MFQPLETAFTGQGGLCRAKRFFCVYQGANVSTANHAQIAVAPALAL
jgi:hypothetical protein